MYYRWVWFELKTQVNSCWWGDVSVKCQRLRHCSKRCQQLHIFHISVNTTEFSPPDPQPNPRSPAALSRTQMSNNYLLFLAAFLVCVLISRDRLTRCFFSPPDVCRGEKKKEICCEFKNRTNQLKEGSLYGSSCKKKKQASVKTGPALWPDPFIGQWPGPPV